MKLLSSGLVCHFYGESVPACWLVFKLWFEYQTVTGQNGLKTGSFFPYLHVISISSWNSDGLPNRMIITTQIQDRNTRNIWQPDMLMSGIQMVRFSNGWAITIAIVSTKLKLIIQNGQFLNGLGMVFQNRTIWQSNRFGPFKYWSCLVFVSPLYSTKKSRFQMFRDSKCPVFCNRVILRTICFLIQRN